VAKAKKSELLRIYICVCGTVGLLSEDEKICCRRCSSEDADWFNIELEPFTEDLKFMKNLVTMKTRGFTEHD